MPSPLSVRAYEPPLVGILPEPGHLQIVSDPVGYVNVILVQLLGDDLALTVAPTILNHAGTPFLPDSVIVQYGSPCFLQEYPVQTVSDDIPECFMYLLRRLSPAFSISSSDPQNSTG
ncbi:MAG: hypothetical protein E7Z70_01875 [Thermoplasmata archaeon]|nr:hypothetical protein [Thermoplasmata archaeon]